jgi:ribonucleoside-diphosphate reductase alpha chain
VGSHLVKNPALEKLLTTLGYNNDTVWKSIMANEGSVDHLDFLTDSDKEVFKTAFEIDQRWVVEHARARQAYICQGQSVNLFFPSGVEKSYVNKVHVKAWKEGLKGLYYLRTEAKSRAENVSEKVERVALQEDSRSIVYSKADCPFCSMAMEEMKLHGIAFDKIDLAEVGKTAAEVTGRKVKTVPQIYIQGEYIGGYEELMAHLSKPMGNDNDDECRACEG